MVVPVELPIGCVSTIYGNTTNATTGGGQTR